MILETMGDLLFTSPLADSLRDLDTGSIAQARDTVGLTDLSGRRLLHIRGRAGDALASVYDAIPDSAGSVAPVSDGVLTQLTADEWMLVADALETNAINRIHDAAGDARCTITDVTHGRGHMLMVGPRAADVLPKLCGLDFDDRAFPDLRAAQTSLAKVRALVVRHDVDELPAYHIIVDYSLAAYVWELAYDAIQEFDGAYIEDTSLHGD